MQKPVVLITVPTFPASELERIATVIVYSPEKDGSSPYEWIIENRLFNADVLCISDRFPVDAQLFDLVVASKGMNLRGLVLLSAGHENVDLDECRKRGIKVAYGGPSLSEITAELCMALLLATCCRFPKAIRLAKEGNWPAYSSGEIHRKEVFGATIGFFGMGLIGQDVARKLEGFRPREIIYNCRQLKKELSKYRFVGFEELLSTSDFLIVVAAANSETTGAFDQNAFLKMKNNAIIVNISRGKLIDTDALYEALTNGKIGAAGLDVTDPEPLPSNNPLYNLENCVITPHIGSMSPTAYQRIFGLGVRNILAILSGSEIPSPLV